MGPDPGRSARPTWWRPALTVSVFAALPFAVFLNDNRAEAELDAALVSYALAVAGLGLVVIAVAGRVRGSSARERAAVVFAVAAFLFFHFDLGRELAEAVGFPADEGLPTLTAWLLLATGAIAAAVRLSRHPIAWSYTAVAGALLLALPVVQYGYFEATDTATAGVETGESPLAGQDLTAASDKPADVYFFLLDGYGRADQLEATVGYDNSRFLLALRRRGFAVHERATAAYPVTFLSLASTLDMGYPAPPGELGDYAPYFAAVEGDNRTVSAFHELGYRFAFATDYSSLECADQVDLCVEPERDLAERLIGEREHAILLGTPLAEVLPALGVHFSPLSGRLSPEDVVEETLAATGQEDSPVFAYAHILAPHPPYRYSEGCEPKEDISEPSLVYWGEADGTGGAEYRQAIECVNRNLVAAVDAILEEKPDAIIVIQGDHGPKFDIDFHRPLGEWSAAELRQRFPILNAQRLPRACSPSGPRAELAVNTFRYVLGCITGEPARPLPARQYMVDLEAGRVEQAELPSLPPAVANR